MNTDDEIMPLIPTMNRTNPFFVNISPIPRDEQIVEPANKYNGINKLYKSMIYFFRCYSPQLIILG